MTMLFLTGDISGGDWARIGFDAAPWEDPAYFREISPITYATAIRTPLLIQHSERDLRTTIAQAEALFTVLRSLRRPVRLLRVPEETHELTRSGTPFRRVENLRIVVDWFRHFLVDGQARPAAATASSRRPLAGSRRPRRTEVYPLRPMTATRRPDTLARERAHELIQAWDGRPGPLGSLLGRVTAVDQVGVEMRVEALKRRSIKKASKLWALNLAISMMDLTTLEGKDTPGQDPGAVRSRRCDPSRATRRSRPSPRCASTRR